MSASSLLLMFMCGRSGRRWQQKTLAHTSLFHVFHRQEKEAQIVFSCPLSSKLYKINSFFFFSFWKKKKISLNNFTIPSVYNCNKACQVCIIEFHHYTGLFGVPIWTVVGLQQKEDRSSFAKPTQ